MPRDARRARPLLEGLEGRLLLAARIETPDGGKINDKDLERYQVQKLNGVPFQSRRLTFNAPDGARVRVTLYGAGTLAGTSMDPDGGVNIVYDGSNAISRLETHVVGGSGRAKLRSMRDADVPITDTTGVNGNLLGTVRLKRFDLIEGGRINLTAGVDQLVLGSARKGSRIDLRQLPTSSANTVQVSGVTQMYADESNGGRVLKSVSGTFVPGPNIIPQNEPGKPGEPPAPPGVVVRIDQVLGTTAAAVDAALITVQGNIQSFRSQVVRGLDMNNAGNFNLVKITDAADSVVTGQPLGHVEIERRENVTLQSTARTVGMRGGVTIIT